MARRKTPFHFTLDADLLAALRRLHEDTGVALAEAIRRALRAYLEREGMLPSRKKGGRR